jgi:hypothetical protein
MEKPPRILQSIQRKSNNNGVDHLERRRDRMTKNALYKLILERLANAPEAAARELLRELNGEDRETATRIFKALKINTAPPHPPKKTE